RPALAARDGMSYEPGTIPDGFYLCADSENPQPEFQQAVIAAVAKVTLIAPRPRCTPTVRAPRRNSATKRKSRRLAPRSSTPWRTCSAAFLVVSLPGRRFGPVVSDTRSGCQACGEYLHLAVGPQERGC